MNSSKALGVGLALLILGGPHCPNRVAAQTTDRGESFYQKDFVDGEKTPTQPRVKDSSEIYKELKRKADAIRKGEKQEATPRQGQDRPRADSFFPKGDRGDSLRKIPDNFYKNPENEQDDNQSETTTDDSKESGYGNLFSHTDPIIEDKTRVNETAANETAKEQPIVGDDSKEDCITDLPGEAVLRISAILGATKIVNFKSNLKSIVDICEQHVIKVGDLYVFGTVDSRDRELRSLLAKLGVCSANFIMNEPLPDDYKKVERSPSWIIETKEGDIILEGEPELSRYIDEYGGFNENGLRFFEEEEESPKV